MIGRLLGIKDAEAINYFDWYFRQSWPRSIAVGLIVAALLYVALLYRAERGLGIVRRVVLGTMRGAVLTIIILMLFEPKLLIELTKVEPTCVLVLVDKSASMAIADRRAEQDQLEEAAMGLGKIAFDAKSGVPLEGMRKDLSPARMDLAKGILNNAQAAVFEQIAGRQPVHYFSFGAKLEPMGAADALAKLKPADKSTALGPAMQQAVATQGGQTIGAVIVVTDGGANEGADPLEAARELGKAGVPVYPIGVGLADPPDVAIRDVIVDEVVFAKERVTARVQLHSSGYERQSVELIVKLDGKELARQTVKLVGGTQFEDLSFTSADKADAGKLLIAATVMPGETIVNNNETTRTIRVTDEKLKVLYVEGKPRWEYRYLRAVLMRDPRMSVQFLMTQGDDELARTDPGLYIDHFPEEAAGAFKYDLVIIGDVPANYFKASQLARIEQLVKDQGGSLLMLAGHRWAPQSYVGTGVANMLPVRVGPESWVPVDDAAYPVATRAGLASAAVALEGLPQDTQSIWANVRPLTSLPVVTSVKEGATVLAEIPAPAGTGKSAYPLIAWQRFGTGKVMFVASDQIWRLRFQKGDTYHARFWAQTVRFLTVSRVLGGNKRIRIAADQKTYRNGDRMHIFATVLNEAYEPIRAPQYSLTMQRKDGDKEVGPLRLDAVATSPGLYECWLTAEKDGNYTIHADGEDASAANAVDMEIKTVSAEDREPAMQEAMLRKMAELSGGRYVSIRDLPKLAQFIDRPGRTVTDRRDIDLWDKPALYVLLILLAGGEWWLRRRSNLV